MGVGVLEMVARSSGRTLVRMSVGVAQGAMTMDVRMEVPAMPPQQQPPGQNHNRDSNRGLCYLLERSRQIPAEQHHRETKGHQRYGMPQPPSQAQEPGPARSRPPVTQEERGHCCEVVRVGRVPQPEQNGHDERGKTGISEVADPIIQAEHEPPV
jgi:hypothetical protein